ncbi:MAG: type II toxin-antitoxin system YafQ family toxin [Treponema sp.]|nr:type II toxin-antitoxin system YafQ family toxin [Treponema sp.]
MLKVRFTNQFKKDYKLALKKGCQENLFREVIEKLVRQEPLPERNKDHQLTGNWTGHRECHITPDWLLIYTIVNEELILELNRTGSHSDLFGKNRK